MHTEPFLSTLSYYSQLEGPRCLEPSVRVSRKGRLPDFGQLVMNGHRCVLPLPAGTSAKEGDS